MVDRKKEDRNLSFLMLATVERKADQRNLSTDPRLNIVPDNVHHILLPTFAELPTVSAAVLNKHHIKTSAKISPSNPISQDPRPLPGHLQYPLPIREGGHRQHREIPLYENATLHG